jgi:hypothetical protein
MRYPFSQSFYSIGVATNKLFRRNLCLQIMPKKISLVYCKDIWNYDIKKPNFTILWQKNYMPLEFGKNEDFLMVCNFIRMYLIFQKKCFKNVFQFPRNIKGNVCEYL